MQVPAGQMSLEYQGIHLAFCSEQCRERFEENPHLYLGTPGNKAVKQTGKKLIKRRCYLLDQPLSTSQAKLLTEKLSRMMGVRYLAIEKTKVEIQYDLLEVTAAQIERTIIEAGGGMGGGLVKRIRRALVHYTEACQTTNMAVSGHRHHGHH